ncbi:hypothetical protein B7R22_17390 [Subtercola boreus]|uniref:G5 domain-containing protein n=2 Tax=Subtercola boreus TaxID=120213 RepID=A0A3E0VS72_9MICO|nr:hypothetical protein B7R22_17390 [Subtercola boreus]
MRGTVGRTLLAGALAAAVVVGLAACGAGSSPVSESPVAVSIGSAGVTSSPIAASPSASPSTTPTALPAAAAIPKVTHQSIKTTAEIPFEATTTDDPDRKVGETAVITAGSKGTKTATWDVTSTDGVETGRVLVSEATTTAPVTEVTAVGSKQPVADPVEEDAGAASGCDPNYEGACVPIDSDVDCAGGSGNGPSYVRGPVTVVGDDIYGLDRDGDGVGCE